MAEPEEITERLLPGTVRVSITIYDAEGGRTYRSITGLAVSGLRVKNRRELNRLWKNVERVTRTGWRDDEQRDRSDAGATAGAGGK